MNRAIVTGDAKLCYVDAPWAYFTTKPLNEQWGDDWDDAPYEHNAGRPYEDAGHEIIKVAFDGPFIEPCDGVINSPYCVQQINRKHVAWLRPCKYGPSPEAEPIFAGVTIDEFCRLVVAGGGRVYR